MKRVNFIAVIQAVVLFSHWSASLCLSREIFFYNYLAVVFAPLQVFLRFGTAYTTEIVLPRRQLKSPLKHKLALQ